MKILLYSQVGHMGGSFGMLVQLARHLCTRHKVVLSAPDIAPEWNSVLYTSDVFEMKNSAEISSELSSFNIALLHLPFAIDDIGRFSFPKKILVVMEIMKRHPLNFLPDELRDFHKALYLHKEQLEPLMKYFSPNQCSMLAIINNIDFQPSFKRTRNIASIGVAQYKHNLSKALQMLLKTWGCRKYLIFGKTEKKEKEEIFTGFYRWFMNYLIRNKRIDFAGIEWDKQKIYSTFDCLFHIPEFGNGTSIVVCDALACGKVVVLSSLKEYREAYGSIYGVYFADDIEFNLTKIMLSYNETKFIRIRSEFSKRYNRDLILSEWEKSLLN